MVTQYTYIVYTLFTCIAYILKPNKAAFVMYDQSTGRWMDGGTNIFNIYIHSIHSIHSYSP